jgi:hypothetical protein
MQQIGLAGHADLALVPLGRELEGVVQQTQIDGVAAALEFLNELLKTDRYRVRRGFGLRQWLGRHEATAPLVRERGGK